MAENTLRGIVGKRLEEVEAGGVEVLTGAVAWNGERQTPVDALVVAGGKVKVIIAIESSNFTPDNLCGIFLALALSTHFTHGPDGRRLEAGDDMGFIQLVDTSELDGDLKKSAPWHKIRNFIQSMLQIHDASMTGGVTNYRIIPGTPPDFEGAEGGKLAEHVRKLTESRPTENA